MRNKELDVLAGWAILVGVGLTLVYGLPALLGCILLAAGWQKMMRG